MNRLSDYDEPVQRPNRILETQGGTFAGRNDGASTDCFWIYSTGEPTATTSQSEYWVMRTSGADSFKAIGSSNGNVKWTVGDASKSFSTTETDVGAAFLAFVRKEFCGGDSSVTLVLHSHAVSLGSSAASLT